MVEQSLAVHLTRPNSSTNSIFYTAGQGFLHQVWARDAEQHHNNGQLHLSYLIVMTNDPQLASFGIVIDALELSP
jgi:hypothetical protein